VSKFWNDFKEFALRGNVVDLAVGIIIGSAFTTIVNSLVDDIIMPPIGLLVGGDEFSDLYMVIKQGSTPGPYPSLADAQAAGAATINYGIFINNVVVFFIVALAVFVLIRGMNRLYLSKQSGEQEEETTKTCPFCKQAIPIEAIRCPFCTSELQIAPAT
jgi:large conductance mechanosensitive channel